MYFPCSKYECLILSDVFSIVVTGPQPPAYTLTINLSGLRPTGQCVKGLDSIMHYCVAEDCCSLWVADVPRQGRSARKMLCLKLAIMPSNSYKHK